MNCILRFARIAFAIAFCLIVIVGCQKNQSSKETEQQPTAKTGEPDRQAVSREELITVLELKDFDRTVLVTNRIKQMEYQGDLIPLLKNIWEGNLADIPRVDKAFVGHPRIRLEIADILLQASRNNRGFNLDPNAYTAYARGLVNSEDSAVAMEAIGVVGIANEPADLPLLEKILTEERNANYRAAAIAYTENCAVNKEALDRVTASIKSEENRSFLNKLWTDFQESRQSVCRKPA
jgi:hypothetical protein